MYKIFDSPKEAYDVVNKEYVDNIISQLLEQIKTLNDKIAELTVLVCRIEIVGPKTLILDERIL